MRAFSAFSWSTWVYWSHSWDESNNCWCPGVICAMYRDEMRYIEAWTKRKKVHNQDPEVRDILMVWRDRKLNLVIMAPSPQYPCCSSTLPHPLLSYPCIYPFPCPCMPPLLPKPIEPFPLPVSCRHLPLTFMIPILKATTKLYNKPNHSYHPSSQVPLTESSLFALYYGHISLVTLHPTIPIINNPPSLLSSFIYMCQPPMPIHQSSSILTLIFMLHACTHQTHSTLPPFLSLQTLSYPFPSLSSTLFISFMPTFSLTHLSHYTSHHPYHSWITPPTLPPLIDWSTTLLSMHEPIYWGWEVGNGVEYCGFWKDSCKWFCWALNICLPATLGCRKWYGWETTLNCLLTWKFSRALPWLYQVLWRGMRL